MGFKSDAQPLFQTKWSLAQIWARKYARFFSRETNGVHNRMAESGIVLFYEGEEY